MSTCELTTTEAPFKGEQGERLKAWYGLLEFEKTLFVIVSVLDVIMTCLLLHTGAFYEANPIANYFLTGWGMIGMTAFKLVAVGFVLTVVNIVAFLRMQAARRLLYFGSTVMGLVVAYSLYLMLRYQGIL